jgi:hypothetical protein
MASTYTTDLAIQLMATGENAGTWGQITNTNLVVIQQAIAGYQAISIAGGAQTTALLMTQNAVSTARNAVIKLTGTITGNQIVTVPNGIEKTWIVSNGTVGAFTVNFKYASTGTGQTWTTTDKGIKILYSDGTDIQVVDLSTLSGTIASAQIADYAVNTLELATNAVTAIKITQSTITQAKLASNSVGATQIIQSTITQAKLATNSVGSNQLISTGVSAATYTTATITVDADGRITSASSGSAGGLGGQTAYTTAGSGIFTIPSGKSTLKVTIVGAGGGGGPGGYGGNPMNGQPNYGYNVPGASGGAAIKYLSVTPGNTINYVVGAGGTSASGPQNGGTGGTSSVSSGNQTITTVSATGGGGGGYNAAVYNTEAGTGSNGDINSKGQNTTLQEHSSSQTQWINSRGAPQFGAGMGGNNGTSAGSQAGFAGAVIFEY